MPITMMFAGDQAGVLYGRYATDYRAMVEAQIVTAERFDFDFVSCISDPACEAADCGSAVQWFDNQPPAIHETQSLLADKKQLVGLKLPDPLGGGRMHNRVQGVGEFCRRVGEERLVEGWLEGPCAESADLRGINRLMLDFYDDPAFVRDLFDYTLELGLRFGKAQVEAGADLIGVGDAAASLVGPAIYHEFVLPYEKRLIDGLHALGARVRLHICGNIGRILTDIGTLGCDIIDVDSKVPMDRVRREVGPQPALLGNIDPVAVLRNGAPAQIIAALEECHRHSGVRYIVGAGCEVPRDTPEANVFALRDYTRAHPPVGG